MIHQDLGKLRKAGRKCCCPRTVAVRLGVGEAAKRLVAVSGSEAASLNFDLSSL